MIVIEFNQLRILDLMHPLVTNVNQCSVESCSQFEHISCLQLLVSQTDSRAAIPHSVLVHCRFQHSVARCEPTQPHSSRLVANKFYASGWLRSFALFLVCSIILRFGWQDQNFFRTNQIFQSWQFVNHEAHCTTCSRFINLCQDKCSY